MAAKVEHVPHHRPVLLPVTNAALQHRCCLHDDAVPEEFAVISTEVLDCFATAFYAAPVGLPQSGKLRFECALVIDEEDGRLRLRLRCAVESSQEMVHPISIETPAVLSIMDALRCSALYKQLDLTPIVCSDDLTCEFSAGYPGELTVTELPGLGVTLPSGEPCWPTSILHAPLPTVKLALQARTILEWLQRGPEAAVH